MEENNDMELNAEYCPKCKHKDLIRVNWNMSNTFYVLFIVMVLILGVWFGRYEARMYREMVYDVCGSNPYFDAEKFTINYNDPNPYGFGNIPPLLGYNTTLNRTSPLS